jgi:hypothetical protein
MSGTLEELKTLLSGWLGVSDNSAPNKTNPGPNGGSTAADSVKTLGDNSKTAAGQVLGLAGAAGKVAIGLASASEKIGSEANGFFKLASEYTSAPTWLTKLGPAAIGQLQSSREGSATGAGGGRFVEFDNNLRSAGLELSDYSQIMKTSRGALNDFGATAMQRADQLTQTGAKVQQIAQRTGLNNQFGEKELGQITALSQYGRTKELTPGKNQDEAAVAVTNLAKTINQVAASSGKSRQAIEAELEERLSSAEVQAKLKVATDEQRVAIIQNQAALSGMGKTAGDTATTIQNNGRLSQDQQVALMAMGPKAMAEFTKANRMLAKDPNDKAAQELLLKSRSDAAAFQGTARFQNMMQNLPDQLKGGFQKSYLENQEAGSLRFAQNNRVPGQSREDAVKAQQQQATNISDSKLPSGQVNPNVAPTNATAAVQGAAFNSANESLRVMSDNLNKLSGSKAGQEALRDVLVKIYGKGGDIDKINANLHDILKQNQTAAATNKIQKEGGNTNPNPLPPPNSGNTNPNTVPIPKKLETKASGGAVNAEQVYIVGENGPELFKSKSAGEIIPTERMNSMFGNIKTKISDIGASAIPKANANLPDMSKLSIPKFEMPDMSKLSIPKFEMPKFEMPNFDMTKFGGPAKESEEAKKKRIGEESLRERPLDPNIQALRDRMSQVNVSTPPKIDVPRFDPNTAIRAEQEQAKKTERDAAVGESVSKQQPPVTKSTEPMPTAGGTVSMKDLNDSLIRLNSSMDKMLKATLDISSHSEKTAKNSGKATGNRTHA